MNDWKNIYGPVPESFEDRVQNTLAGLETSRTRRRPRKIGRTLLIAAAVASVLSVTALAAGLDRVGFFHTLFGTGAVVKEQAEVTPTPAPPEPQVAADGTVTQQAYEYTWQDGWNIITSVMPGYERTPVDEEMAERLVGPYVQELNKTFSLPNTGGTGEYADRENTFGDVTVTLLSYVQDEADTGYLYFSVENPEGLKLQTWEKRGYTVAGESSVNFLGGTVRIQAACREFLVDTENSTDTKVYIGVPIAYVGEHLNTLTVGDAYQEVGGFQEEYTLHADRLVPARTAQGQYVTATISPMGARLTAAEGRIQEVLIDALDSFTVTMTDGSEYVVFRDGGESADAVDNTTYLCGMDNRSENMCFNRIIDPEQIASVTVTVRTGWDENGQPVRATETIEF